MEVVDPNQSTYIPYLHKGHPLLNCMVVVWSNGYLHHSNLGSKNSTAQQRVMSNWGSFTKLNQTSALDMLNFQRRLRDHRLLCKGFDPVGTLRFSELKTLAWRVEGALTDGLKTCWLLADAGLGKLVPMARLFVGAKRRSRVKRRQS
ncbi:Hypothetical predicted protein [Prunus dulcis]|uniref:Uncharacterized protein n=1 Tax=Prunus dulcis TaxID=3755 RepID=A0A5E4EPH0_PRUDU|nr:Hypothetical predicted protein [Prunus dulcis]